MGQQEYEPLRYPRRITDRTQAQLPTPGKATNTHGSLAALPAQAASAAVNGIYASPGSMWSGGALASPGPFKTGSALADKGLGCAPVGDAPIHGPCFLESEQRKYLLGDYRGRVIEAASQFHHALADVKVEELIKNEQPEANWLFEIFLDVISLVALNSVKTALRALVGGTADLGVMVSDPQRAINELSTVTENQLAAILGSGARVGRVVNQLEQTAQAAKNNPEKTSNLSFLDSLRARASDKYNQLRERAPAGASDSELVALFHGFDPDNGHKAADYGRAIREQLGRFKKSGVSRLGVRNNTPNIGVDSEHPEAYFQIATAAFWVNTPVGRRLGLYRRGHHAPPTTVYDPTFPASPRIATPKEIEQLKRDDLRARPYEFVKFVPQDFVDAAVQIHVARWGTTPEEHALGGAEFQAMAWDQ